MNPTKIEYLTHTWNPLAMLCDPISAGCKNCWHRRRANMLAHNPMIPKKHQAAYAGKSDPLLVESRLEDPHKRIKPAVIGVQFMGDLFKKRVAFCDIEEVFEVIAQSIHTFLILTKRPNTMGHYCNTYMQRNIHLPDNLWLGVSVEDPDNLWRIDELLKIRAAVRFVSVEPMLEEINLGPYLSLGFVSGGVFYNNPNPRPDLVIAGPETGPGARPMPVGAITGLYHQCRDAGIPFFDKRENFLAREFPDV
jgi:protein gp37